MLPNCEYMYPFRRWRCLIHSGKCFGRTSASSSCNSNSPSLKRFPIAHTAGKAALPHNANASHRHIWLNETKYSSVKISLFSVYTYIPTYQRNYISQLDVRCTLQRVAIACSNFVLHIFRLWLCKNEKSDNYISICLERDALDSWALAHWMWCEVQFSLVGNSSARWVADTRPFGGYTLTLHTDTLTHTYGGGRGSSWKVWGTVIIVTPERH